VQLITTKRGFTLVELAVTLGITGLMTVMFMRLSLSSYNQEAHLRYKASVNETLAMVQNALRDPNKCTEMFKGQTITAGGAELPVGIMMNGGTVNLLRKGNYADFEVESIKLADSVFTNTSFDVVIDFKPRGISAFNSFFNSGSKISKRITVVGIKQAGQVKTCGPTLSDTKLLVKKTFCNNMKSMGSWDGEKCVLKYSTFKCNPPYIPYEMRNNGTLNCTHIAYRVEYDNIFDFDSQECSSKNYSFYQNPEGKIRIGCPTAAEKAAGVAVPLQ
jgi:prepilin-type N-terminal cleavage/methylation domain-containing protein